MKTLSPQAQRRRVVAVCLVALGGLAAVQTTAVAEGSAASGLAAPRVLREAALQSPKALGAATLAVVRVGKRLVAVGERGTVLLSDDAGEHWQQASVPVQVTLTSVRFVNARTGWAAGHLGVILRSDDAGQTWVKQLDGQQAAAAVAATAGELSDERAQRNAQRFAEDGPDKPFFDLDFADAQNGFAVGAYNMAFATRDGGKTWQPALQRLPNPKSLHLYGVRYVAGKLYVVGEQGLLLRSDDAGESFHALASPYKGSFFGLLGARSGSLIAYGLRGNAVRSTDQGEHWDKLETGLPMSISAAAELNAGTLALLSQTGELLLSRDDGVSFNRVAPNGGPLPAAGLALADEHHLVYASLRGLRRQTLP
ncbi:MAG: glycosyl hydrolase [Burkholderiales bacterium RIFOXYD12_FULL_59_19]|nr:MAG: glycosyl hydrolase [Burkholderiales bacterium RIFOXYD12_FULL_59_19]